MIPNMFLQSWLFPELIFTIQLPTLDIQQASQTSILACQKQSSPCSSHTPPFLVSPHFSRGSQHYSLGCSGYVVRREREWQKSIMLDSFFAHSTSNQSTHYVAQLFKIYSESDHPHYHYCSPNSQSLLSYCAPNWFSFFYPCTLPGPHLKQPVYSFKNVMSCRLLFKIFQSLPSHSECNTKYSRWPIGPHIWISVFIFYDFLPSALVTLASLMFYEQVKKYT